MKFSTEIIKFGNYSNSGTIMKIFKVKLSVESKKKKSDYSSHHINIILYVFYIVSEFFIINEKIRYN